MPLTSSKFFPFQSLQYPFPKVVRQQAVCSERVQLKMSSSYKQSVNTGELLKDELTGWEELYQVLKSGG
jgi:hypothetical protein